MGEKINIFDINYELDELTFVDPTIIGNRGKLLRGLSKTGVVMFDQPRLSFRGIMGGRVRTFDREFPFPNGERLMIEAWWEGHMEAKRSWFRRTFRKDMLEQQLLARAYQILHERTDMRNYFDKIEVEMRQYVEGVKAQVEHYHANRQKAAA